MNGCIYRTKHGECKDPSRDKEFGPLCRSDCTNKHPSNADRIRAMSDEELAEWLTENYSGNCPDGFAWNEGCCLPDDCKGCWLEWLKLEVTDD